MERNFELKQALRNHIFVQPATRGVRPYLIKYVLLLVAEAKKLPEDELLDPNGHEIAVDICGALAWQGAEGVENDGWFNEKDEPVLSELLDVTGVLDVDANHPDKWQRLFELAKHLQ